MTPETYMKEVLKTESTDMGALKRRLSDEKTIRLLHAAVGLSTEAGEVLDVLKKHIYYGRVIDEVNLIEEVGDALWYLFVMLDALSSTSSEAMMLNIAKLHKKRYKQGKFTEDEANNRDLEAEREILEGKEGKDENWRSRNGFGSAVPCSTGDKENITKELVESKLNSK